jgi:hypothetical protein
VWGAPGPGGASFRRLRSDIVGGLKPLLDAAPEIRIYDVA